MRALSAVLDLLGEIDREQLKGLGLRVESLVDAEDMARAVTYQTARPSSPSTIASPSPWP